MCKTDDITTERAYVALFASAAAAKAYEDIVLSAGREYLPQSARDVLDGEEPTAEYWQFLREQAAEGGAL